MIDVQVLADGFVLLPLNQMVFLSLFYATLFWLPIRGAAALLEHYTDRERQTLNPELALDVDPGYRVGMDVEPPI